MDITASTTRISPCAGCKARKKKCSEECVLAPFFPRNDPEKFLLVNRVFGNAHVIKTLQDLPAEHRSDAVRSMVYEANQRLRDPVHGSLGVINDLEKRVAELESKLDSMDSTEAQLSNINLQHANLLTLITRDDEVWGPLCYDASLQQENINVQHANFFSLITRGDEGWGPLCYNASLQQENIEDMDVDELWEPLWT